MWNLWKKCELLKIWIVKIIFNVKKQKQKSWIIYSKFEHYINSYIRKMQGCSILSRNISDSWHSCYITRIQEVEFTCHYKLEIFLCKWKYHRLFLIWCRPNSQIKIRLTILYYDKLCLYNNNPNTVWEFYLMIRMSVNI
jgi:hypothetical protein